MCIRDSIEAALPQLFVGDVQLVLYTCGSSGAHGEIGIAFTVVLLAFRRTRRAGLAMALALGLYMLAGHCDMSISRRMHLRQWQNC